VLADREPDCLGRAEERLGFGVLARQPRRRLERDAEDTREPGIQLGTR
jgi:hypothetical protein